MLASALNRIRSRCTWLPRGWCTRWTRNGFGFGSTKIGGIPTRRYPFGHGQGTLDSSQICAACMQSLNGISRLWDMEISRYLSYRSINKSTNLFCRIQFQVLIATIVQVLNNGTRKIDHSSTEEAYSTVARVLQGRRRRRSFSE